MFGFMSGAPFCQQESVVRGMVGKGGKRYKEVEKRRLSTPFYIPMRVAD